jgi:hypothetical protein
LAIIKLRHYPRGGYRPCAGRPPGASTAKSRAIAERAIAQGITPLEAMLDNMRFYHSEAIVLVAKLIAAGMPEHLTEDDEAKPDAPKNDQPHANVMEAIGQVLRLRKLTGAEAARAALYMHPRMGYASDERSTDDEIIPLAERLKEWDRRDNLKSASDKVVELNPQSDQGADPSGSEPIPPPLS